jgi:hypothetical protein
VCDHGIVFLTVLVCRVNIQLYRVPEQKLYEEVVNSSQPKNRAIERVRSSGVGYINRSQRSVQQD